MEIKTLDKKGVVFLVVFLIVIILFFSGGVVGVTYVSTELGCEAYYVGSSTNPSSYCIAGCGTKLG